MSTTVVRNSDGKLRIRSIDVELAPSVVDAGGARLARCEELFEDFCIVTQSVRHGIPVNATVRERKAAA